MSLCIMGLIIHKNGGGKAKGERSHPREKIGEWKTDFKSGK